METISSWSWAATKKLAEPTKVPNHLHTPCEATKILTLLHSEQLRTPKDLPLFVTAGGKSRVGALGAFYNAQRKDHRTAVFKQLSIWPFSQVLILLCKERKKLPPTVYHQLPQKPVETFSILKVQRKLWLLIVELAQN